LAAALSDFEACLTAGLGGSLQPTHTNAERTNTTAEMMDLRMSISLDMATGGFLAASFQSQAQPLCELPALI
jgi:hypothetical protein